MVLKRRASIRQQSDPQPGCMMATASVMTPAFTGPPDPVIEVYKKDVDRTLKLAAALRQAGRERDRRPISRD